MTVQTETAGGHVFATAAKSTAGYLDEGTNLNGPEKIGMVLRALGRTEADRPHLVEIGPGGGAALQHLTDSLTRALDITLIEAPGVVSQTLTHAIERFKAADLGTCTLINGWAQDLETLLAGKRADIITASALLHEVYSYGTGYQGIHELMRTLIAVLKPGGHFAYRDVLTVDAPTLHETVTQTYDAPVWLLFISMFAPEYLRGSRHPYHRSSDTPTVRQNSCTVALENIDPRTSAVITGPIGLFREIQRHYITLRKDVWRSGVLGFRPDMDGWFSADWINSEAGQRRVHFEFTEGISPRLLAVMTALSEPFKDHRAMDGDTFDTCTDAAIIGLLTAAKNGDERCAVVWRDWNTSEGHETYGYLTVAELLTEFAIKSAEANTGTVMLPLMTDDVATPGRAYYTRYLRNHLPNPLRDGKQLILFTNVPVTDTEAITTGLEILRPLCSRDAMAQIHSAIAQMM
ncbi:methyltransferase domain-containing protein [Streptomyces sp. NPDC088135]|uniref:methyltransferase domain-containing protein n=1 Tax=Streptomyces sp. NPDC088135 TaxID=3160993 RepID=UPI0034129033